MGERRFVIFEYSLQYAEIPESELKRRLKRIIGTEVAEEIDEGIDILLHGTGQPKDEWREWVDTMPDLTKIDYGQMNVIKTWFRRMPRK